MKKILCLVIVIMLLLTCVGCSDVPKTGSNNDKSIYICVEEGWLYGYRYSVLYHKDTKVMYHMNQYGEATVMLDADGKPLLWEE